MGFFGFLALCVGIWAEIQLYKESKKKQVKTE